jgi:hypothetical protein
MPGDSAKGRDRIPWYNFLMLLEPPLTPIIVKVVGAPTPELGVGDILLQSLGLTGLILVGSLVFGLVVGGLFIAFKFLLPFNRLNGQASQRDGLHLDLGPR